MGSERFAVLCCPEGGAVRADMNMYELARSISRDAYANFHVPALGSLGPGRAAVAKGRAKKKNPKNEVHSDARCIEVVANGLPLWHGAQLAIDATIVCPVTRAGMPQPGTDARPGAAVQAAARRKRRQTYPELCERTARAARRRRVEVGARFGAEAASFLRHLARHRAASLPPPLQAAASETVEFDA